VTRHYDDLGTGPEWATPTNIYEPVAEAVGGFDLDPAAGAESEPIAATRWTAEDNGLGREWFGDVFLNPPYGRVLNPVWARYAHAQVHLADRHDGDLRSLIALVPASTSTYWWQDHYRYADAHAMIPYKITFRRNGEQSTNNASFASILCVWWLDGDVPERVLDALREAGKMDRPNPIMREVPA